MPAVARRPNVLLITTDQQRFDALGASGNPFIRTPNLDRLAQRGVQFRHGYIQNPVCIPSRACIQTGRYPHQHGVEYMEDVIATTPGLPPWEVTVMERLQQAGYTAAAFGKIHMLPPRGFDEMQLTMGKGARWTEAEGSPLGPAQLGPAYAAWLERKRPGAYESIYAQRRLPIYREQATAIVNTLAADEYVDYWIGQNSWEYLARPHEQPFFLWCGFCGPHPPFDPPEPYAGLYDQASLPVPRLLQARQQGTGDSQRASRFDRPDGVALLRTLTAYYWGMVSCIDDLVGRIMQVLTERQLWQDTLLIFTSDHGELLGDFGRLGKGNFLEPVIRVPYLLVPPGNATGGASYDGLVEHIDLVPTILDYAGLAPSAALPGRSLRPILEGQELARKDGILCEYVSNDRQRRGMCLRTERAKYVVWSSGQPAECYDLQKDPDELVNVAADPAYRAVVLEHAQLLLQRLLATPWRHVAVDQG